MEQIPEQERAHQEGPPGWFIALATSAIVVFILFALVA
jgi:hypothetical protein